jgi:hypothetical protein
MYQLDSPHRMPGNGGGLVTLLRGPDKDAGPSSPSNMVGIWLYAHRTRTVESKSYADFRFDGPGDRRPLRAFSMRRASRCSVRH